MFHIHWRFVAYESTIPTGNPGQSVYKDGVNIEVVNYATQEEALAAVQKLVARPFYSLLQIWECSQCLTGQRHIRAIEDMGRHLKKHV